MDTTFKRPLAKKRTDFSITPTVLDHAGVGKIYHERIEESWYPQGEVIKPNVPCTYKCGAEYDPNKKLWMPGCNGQCVSC